MVTSTRQIKLPAEGAEQAVAHPVPPLSGVTPLTVDIREVYASAGTAGDQRGGQADFLTSADAPGDREAAWETKVNGYFLTAIVTATTAATSALTLP